MIQLQEPVRLPVFGAEAAECGLCSLDAQRKLHGTCPAQPPVEHFNGLMVVGEGPGRVEISQKVPFVGPAGKMLDDLLYSAGIKREECYISNATMCLPPFAGDDQRGFTERHPLATYACLPRLEAEIAAVRPRVILALGQAALESLTGRDFETAKRIAFTCPTCGDPPKRAKSCPGCKGYKTEVQIQKNFETEHQIGRVAGLVFHTDLLPSRLDTLGVKYIIATYHPSYIIRKANTKAQAQVGGQFIASAVCSHMQKAARLLSREAVWNCTPVITSDPAVVAKYVDQRTSFFGCDIETDSAEPYDVTEIKCIGIGVPDRDEVLVVDTRTPSDALLTVLRDFLEDPTKPKVWQNRFYDEQVWYLRHRITVRGTFFDTMLGHHSLYPDEPHHLQHISSIYTDAMPWKPPKAKGGISAFETFEELALYNARDVRSTCLIVEPMVAEMALENVRQVHDMDLRMTDVALEMQAVGLPLDRERLNAIGEAAGKEADAAMAAMLEIIATAPPPEGIFKEGVFNPGATKHLQWVLFDKAGPCRLTSVLKTNTGLDATNKDALNKYNHPFVDALLKYREHHKLKSTYVDGEGLRAGPDGRLHPKWNVTGARTGRWSSSPNFQNWPKLVRSAIRAPEGRKLIGSDYDQLELRVIAALSGDEEMIRRCMTADKKKKLEPDHDPHSFVASLAFGRVFADADPYDTTHDASLYKDGKCPCGMCRRNNLREAAKRVVYGLNYGAGAQKILEVILDGGWTGGVLTIEIVQRVINAYFRGFPAVPRWRDAQLRIAKETQEVRSPILQRRRYFPLGEVDPTVAYNFPIQSCAADIMNTRLWELYQSIGSVDATAVFIAQVHDAIYLECDAALAETVAAHVTKTMSTELVLVEGAPAMRFGAGAKIGDTWDSV